MPDGGPAAAAELESFVGMTARATTPSPAAPDAQARVPATQVSLSRVGVTGVEKVIRVKADGAENLFHADFECFVDLEPRQAGVHMSRFEEIVGEAIDEVVLGEAFRAEVLAAHIAQRVRERQDGRRAEVSVTARYPETATTPATGQATQEIYGLLGTAVASERGTRTLTGVQAQGMTACPCAQEMVAELGRERLAAEGFDVEQIERVLAAVPVATHNQRGVGTLHIGCPEGGAKSWVDAPELLRIVEGSMSSEIYELMKRPDELAVVAKAHAQPRFVEDCVREMVRRVVEGYAELPDEAFVMARQENLETIHRHDVVAERYGTLADLRRELASGEHLAHHTTMREWLELAAS